MLAVKTSAVMEGSDETTVFPTRRAAHLLRTRVSQEVPPCVLEELAFYTFLDSPLEHHRVPRRIYAPPLVGARSGYRRGVPPVLWLYFWPFWIPPWSTTVLLGEFTRLSWVRALATAGVCHRCMGGTSGPRLPTWGFRCYTRRCALRFSPESAPPPKSQPEFVAPGHF